MLLSKPVKYLLGLVSLGLVLVAAPALQAGGNHADAREYRKLMRQLEHDESVAEFSEAEILLEQNFTDGDVEVVIAAKGGDVGMQRFWLFSPERKLVYAFESPKKRGNIGGREIVVESPEPADTSIVLAAYPPGTYTFIARSMDGEWLLSHAELVHDIPAPASITYPQADSLVSRYDFEVIWESVVVADKFVVELVNEETDAELLVDVSGDTNGFRAPEEWLQADTEYQVSVGVVNEFGNITFVEQSVFTTLD